MEGEGEIEMGEEREERVVRERVSERANSTITENRKVFFVGNRLTNWAASLKRFSRREKSNLGGFFLSPIPFCFDVGSNL